VAAGWTRRIGIASAGLGATTMLLAGGSVAWVAADSSPFRRPDVDAAPPSDVAIVLGASVYASGRPSAVVEDRLATALALFRAGKVRKILVSGDHGHVSYDEVNAMRRWLASAGVPERDLRRGSSSSGGP
jgi:SanA protein